MLAAAKESRTVQIGIRDARRAKAGEKSGTTLAANLASHAKLPYSLKTMR
jgi:hypothetical protein